MEEGQKELEVKEFSAKSGGGAVEAVVNGKKGAGKAAPFRRSSRSGRCGNAAGYDRCGCE